MSSKVGSVLARLLRRRLDGYEMSAQCKGLQEEKKGLAGKVEGIAVERDELSKVIAYLEAWLKASKSNLEEFELQGPRRGMPTRGLKRS